MRRVQLVSEKSPNLVRNRGLDFQFGEAFYLLQSKLVRRIKILVRSVYCNGVGCLLLLSEERQKGEKMTILLVRAFRFHVCVRLKDDYKSECGQ